MHTFTVGSESCLPSLLLLRIVLTFAVAANCPAGGRGCRCSGTPGVGPEGRPGPACVAALHFSLPCLQPFPKWLLPTAALLSSLLCLQPIRELLLPTATPLSPHCACSQSLRRIGSCWRTARWAGSGIPPPSARPPSAALRSGSSGPAPTCERLRSKSVTLARLRNMSASLRSWAVCAAAGGEVHTS